MDTTIGGICRIGDSPVHFKYYDLIDLIRGFSTFWRFPTRFLVTHLLWVFSVVGASLLVQKWQFWNNDADNKSDTTAKCCIQQWRQQQQPPNSPPSAFSFHSSNMYKISLKYFIFVKIYQNTFKEVIFHYKFCPKWLQLLRLNCLSRSILCPKVGQMKFDCTKSQRSVILTLLLIKRSPNLDNV